MNLLLIIVFAILLITAIIWLLHQGQAKNRADIVDRTAPLPLLREADHTLAEPSLLNRATDITAAPIQDDLIKTTKQPVAPSHMGAEAALEEKTSVSSSIESPPESAAVPPSLMTNTDPLAGTVTEEDTKPEDSSAESWQEHVKLLREQDDLNAALLLCQQHYPRIQAFQQAGIVLRQKIRVLIEQHKPVTAQLQQLYQVAVMADLFRSANPHKPINPILALDALNNTSFDYLQIGHQLLRLLTKSDIKHLEQLHGSPQQHQHAEEALGAQWQALCEIP